VKADYVGGTNPGDTSAVVNPIDTFGTGRWDYYQTDTFGAGGSLTLLEWDGTQNPGSGPAGRYERAGVNHSGGNPYDFPQFAHQGGYGGHTAAASEVFVHPSDTGNSGGGTETKARLRWTAGAGEAGPATFLGSVRRPSGANSGGQMKVFVDGAEQFDSGVLRGSGAIYNFSTNVHVGSVVDFVFDPVGDNHNDDSMYLSAEIYNGTPPPPPAATPAHRYSFKGNGVDSIGSADLGVIGGASFGPTSLDLPNTTPGGGNNDDQARATGASLTELANTVDTAGDLTIEAWINQDRRQRYSKFFTTGANNTNFITITPAFGGPDTLTAQIDTSEAGGGAAFADSGLQLADGTDYYVAVALDDTNDLMTLYVGEVGGVLHFTSVAMPQSLADIDLTAFSLGSPLFWGDQDWDGKIDELRILDSALTSDQIVAHFAAGPNTIPGQGEVPEPASAFLVLLALAGLGRYARRRKA
jgi:hypothetical protein